MRRKRKGMKGETITSSIIQNMYGFFIKRMKWKKVILYVQRQNAQWDVYHALIPALRDSPGDGES
jgi:hypothetical protein